MAWEARSGLKHSLSSGGTDFHPWLNGLGSPFGIETTPTNAVLTCQQPSAKWPGKPVRD